MTGEVSIITFQKDDYTIAKLTNNTAVLGEYPGGLQLGASYIFEGDWVENAKYGRQFKFTSASLSWDLDALGILKYLMTLPGVGKATATQIVSKHSADTIKAIEGNLPLGLSRKRTKKICEAHAINKQTSKAVIALTKLGLGPALVTKVLQEYGDKATEIATEEPYRMINEIDGVGWEIADRVGRRGNIELNSDQRIRAAILYILECAAQEGHTRIAKKFLAHRIGRIDITDLEGVETQLTILSSYQAIKQDVDWIGINKYFQYEAGIAHAVTMHKLRNRTFFAYGPDGDWSNATSEQKFAVLSACTGQGVTILTGGPGTGKTTTIDWIVQSLPYSEIMLCAPTGKAANRMGGDAKTIHRLLGYSPKNQGWEFNGDNPLKCDLVICDEASMLDAEIAFRLVDAINPFKTKLVLVGDIDQLPSVGAGNVLRDLIASGVQTYRLTHIHRQSLESGIVQAAR